MRVTGQGLRLYDPAKLSINGGLNVTNLIPPCQPLYVPPSGYQGGVFQRPGRPDYRQETGG